MDMLDSYFETSIFKDTFRAIQGHDFNAALESIFSEETKSDPLLNELRAYGEKRIAYYTSAMLLERLHFQVDNLPSSSKYNSIQFSITLSEDDGYLDFKAGTKKEEEFVHHSGYACGTLVVLDTLNSERDEYPVLRGSKRSLHEDDESLKFKYKKKSLMPSHLLQTWHLVVLSQVLNNLISAVQKDPIYKKFKILYQLDKTTDREPVTTWSW